MIVGQRTRVTVQVRDGVSGNLVDPATFSFAVNAVDATKYGKTQYEWTSAGGVWSPTEDDFGEPSHVSTGVFEILVSIPYDNDAAGRWVVGWQTTSNADGEGGGSGEQELHAARTKAI